ncbi:D-threonate kinase [Sporomusa carbonis]|uniref:four-carbon acid sugar kinase family protein n=1 Tax=Sporomusa carbonis TaxID=3076075 RepID=UPI003A6D527B
MIVIADDLTGANDTGVQFTRQGLKTEVILEETGFADASQAAVVVIDTNSRALPADQAYAKVQRVAKQAQESGFYYVYKKLDSTLRGNVGVELKAILDLGLHDFAFVMPAFPKNGRTTIGGYHLLHGVPLSATEIAKDPKCPVNETLLPKLLQQQSSLQVGHIGFELLGQGQEAVTRAIRQYLQGGAKIISCDAWQDEQFRLAAAAAASISNQVLWVGSAGLAEFLPELFGWNEQNNSQKPTLVIAGSVSAATREQIKALVAEGHVWIDVEVADLLPWQPADSLPSLEKALNCLARGKNVVLTSGCQPEAVSRAIAAGAKLGLSNIEVSNTIAEILGWLGAAIVNKQPVAGIVLTGGDTAVAVCRALGVTGIRVVEEIAPGIPLGEMTTADGITLSVVTKAGAFGDPDALVKATRKLQQRS